MNLKDLFSGIEHEGDLPDIEIREISCEPQRCGEGILTVIYKRIGRGQNDYVMPNDAITVCESDDNIVGGIVIRVSKARYALSMLCSNFSKIDYNKLTFIGITGTNGKTTTATLCERILKYAGINVGFIGTGRIEYMGEILADTDYSMTTPDPTVLFPVIRKMQALGCTHIVMEVSSQAISLSKVIPIKFKVGAFLNLSEEHLDNHGSMEEYYRAKLSLFKNTEIGVFNADDTYSTKAKTHSGISIFKTIGIINDADLGVCELNDLKDEGYEYILRSGDLYFKLRQHLPGAFNVYNVLFAVAITEVVGIKNSLIRRAINEIYLVEGRCEIIKDEIRVIIDYAHTPCAMTEIISFAKSISYGNRVITLFGCGGERDRGKRPLMARAAEKHSDLLFITEDNSRREDPDIIIADIVSGIHNMERVRIIPDRECAIKEAILSANTGDTVLIVGKGNESYNDKEGKKRAFDERAIVKNALLMRKHGSRA